MGGQTVKLVAWRVVGGGRLSVCLLVGGGRLSVCLLIRLVGVVCLVCLVDHLRAKIRGGRVAHQRGKRLHPMAAGNLK